MTITVLPTSTVNVASGANGSAGAASSPFAALEGADALPAEGLFAQLLGTRLDGLGATASRSKDKAEEKPAKEKAEARPVALATDPLQIVALQPVKIEDRPLVLATTPKGDEATDALTDLLSAKSRKPTGQDADDLQNLPLGKAMTMPLLPQDANAGATGKAAAVPVFSVPTPVSDPAWGRAIGNQVIAMANVKMDKATIEINPPQLGPIEVQLKLDDKTAQVMFTAANPATRDAIENNLPRLSQMLSAGGLQLTDAQVFSGQQEQRQAFQQNNKSQKPQDTPAEEGLDALAAIQAARNMLSIFA